MLVAESLSAMIGEDIVIPGKKPKEQILIDYLLMKVDENDWHGVADAAMDLRGLEASEMDRSQARVIREK